MKLNTLTNTIKSQSESKLTLVFLHGNSMKADFYQHQIFSLILQDFNTKAYDLPGHGKSPRLQSYNIPVLLKALEQNLEDLDNIVLIGHSLGGHIAIQLLPYLKGRCKHIVLIGCPPLTLPLNVEEAYVLNDISANFLQKDVEDDMIRNMVKLIYPFKDSVSKQITNAFKKTDSQFRKDFATSLIKGEMEDEVNLLKSFKGKIASILGSEDAVLNFGYVAKLNNEIDNSELHIIENCGHCPQIEKPQELNELIAKFVYDLK